MLKFSFVEEFFSPIPIEGQQESVSCFEIPEKDRFPIIPFQWKNEECSKGKLISDQGHECPAVFMKKIRLDLRFSGTGRYEQQTIIVWVEERQEWIAFQKIWHIFEDAYGYYSESISFAGPWSLDITHIKALLKIYGIDESNLVKMVPYLSLDSLKVTDINKYTAINSKVQNSHFGSSLRTITEILAYLRSQTFLSDCYRYSPEENWYWAQAILTDYLYSNFDSLGNFQTQLETLAYGLQGLISEPLTNFRQAEELMARKIFEGSTQKKEHEHVWKDVPDTYKFVNPKDCPSAYVGGDDVYHVDQRCKICGIIQTRQGSLHGVLR